MTSTGRCIQPRVRVLVVDDNSDILLAVKTGLELLGYAVETAGDGHTALERARTFSPDVALLDLSLPKMDGYELAKRLRAQHSPGLYLIALTGSPLDASQQSFDQHLLKPVDLMGLVRALSQIERPRHM